MLENKIFQEIPTKANFHSAVMTTFSFDFHHFESQVLKPLLKKGIVNINVFADSRMLDDAIGTSTGNLRSVNLKYNVNSIESVGAFHPKLTLLVGENDVMLIQGSGNITGGGHGKNHEIFNVLYADKEDRSQLALINEAWHYMLNLTSKVEGITKDKLNWISQNCTLLENNAGTKHQYNLLNYNIELALLYNAETSIWQQITELIPAEEIAAIKVFSPFYDENGAFIKNLSNSYSNSSIDVFLEEERGIHPHKMENINGVDFYSWNSTERANSKFKSYERKLHSKIFVFESNETEYCIIGSPNATIPGFGTSNHRGANDEFAVLYKSPKINFIQLLSLDGDYESLTPKDVQKQILEDNDIEEDKKTPIAKVKMYGADKDLNKINLYFNNKPNYTKVNCVVYNTWGEEIENHKLDLKSKNKIIFDLLDLKQTNIVAYLQLFNQKGEAISNKQMINTVGSLLNTNPSTENRKLLRLTTLIESGNDGIFDILNFLNDINTNRNTNNTISSSSASQENDNIINGPTISYEEALELNNKREEHERLFGSHNSVKIMDAIEKFIRIQIALEEEENMNDEEQAEASSSRERKENKPIKVEQLSSHKVLENRRKSIERLFNNYIHTALKTASQKDNRELTIMDFAMFIIMLRQLFRFTLMEVELKNLKDGENKTDKLYPLKGNYNRNNNYLGTLLNLMGQFVNLLYNSEISIPNDDYSKEKLKNYISISRNLSLFAIGIAKQSYQNDKIHNWLELLSANIINKLEKPNKALKNTFVSLLSSTNFKGINIELIQSDIDKWCNINVSSNLSNLRWVSDKFGLCDISKIIPVGSENPKFIQLSRPGFDYNKKEKTFIKPGLMSLETGIFMKSKQSIIKK